MTDLNKDWHERADLNKDWHERADLNKSYINQSWKHPTYSDIVSEKKPTLKLLPWTTLRQGGHSSLHTLAWLPSQSKSLPWNIFMLNFHFFKCKMNTETTQIKTLLCTGMRTSFFTHRLSPLWMMSANNIKNSMRIGNRALTNHKHLISVEHFVYFTFRCWHLELITIRLERIVLWTSWKDRVSASTPTVAHKLQTQLIKNWIESKSYLQLQWPSRPLCTTGVFLIPSFSPSEFNQSTIPQQHWQLGYVPLMVHQLKDCLFWAKPKPVDLWLTKTFKPQLLLSVPVSAKQWRQLKQCTTA